MTTHEILLPLYKGELRLRVINLPRISKSLCGVRTLPLGLDSTCLSLLYNCCLPGALVGVTVCLVLSRSSCPSCPIALDTWTQLCWPQVCLSHDTSTLDMTLRSASHGWGQQPTPEPSSDALIQGKTLTSS